MNGARGFATNRLDDAGMRMAERVDGNTAEKVEVLFAGGIEHVGAAATSKKDGLALVRGKKEPLRFEDNAGICACGSNGALWVSHRHHAAESAACEAENGSRRTRVPGISSEAVGDRKSTRLNSSHV